MNGSAAGISIIRRASERRQRIIIVYTTGLLIIAYTRHSSQLIGKLVSRILLLLCIYLVPNGNQYFKVYDSHRGGRIYERETRERRFGQPTGGTSAPANASVAQNTYCCMNQNNRKITSINNIILKSLLVNHYHTQT